MERSIYIYISVFKVLHYYSSPWLNMNGVIQSISVPYGIESNVTHRSAHKFLVLTNAQKKVCEKQCFGRLELEDLYNPPHT